VAATTLAKMAECGCLGCRLDSPCKKLVEFDKGVNAQKADTLRVLEELHTGEFFEVRWSELLEKLGLSK